MIKIYGIKNCDTVKKATVWLKDKGLNFEFHDYKTLGISKEKLNEWIDQIGLDILINRKGTTWKQLDEKTQAGTKDKKKAIQLMQEKTSVIKRPIVELNKKVILVGFNESEYSQKLK